MDVGSFKAGVVSLSSAFVASLCCLLPLTVVLLGLGSGAFMTITMQYSYIFLPVGVIGVGLGYFLYFGENKRCKTVGCTFAGRKTNLMVLVVATAIVTVSLLLNFFPELTSRYLSMAM